MFYKENKIFTYQSVLTKTSQGVINFNALNKNLNITSFDHSVTVVSAKILYCREKKYIMKTKLLLIKVS